MDMLEYVRTSMWIVFLATALVNTGLGVILGYHWLRYSGSPHGAKISIGVYFLVTVSLLLAMYLLIPA